MSATKIRLILTLDRADLPRSVLQSRGRTGTLLREGRQLVIDHRAEIEERPEDVYGSHIRQDGDYTAEDLRNDLIASLSNDGVAFGVM